MTVAPERKPLAFEDVEDVAAAIRENGGRLSSACRITLEALFAAEGPVSATYIAEGLGGKTIPTDVSSVYRNLERLEELGVVRHLHAGHGPGLYQLEGSGSAEYIVCERCDRVTRVEPSELEEIKAIIRKRYGYEASFSHFPIVGLCAQCAGGRPDASAHEHSHGDYVHSHPPVSEPGHKHHHH